MDTSTTDQATQTTEKSLSMAAGIEKPVSIPAEDPSASNTFFGPQGVNKSRNVLKEDVTSWTKASPEEPAVEPTPDEKPVEEPTASAVTKEGEESRDQSDQVKQAYQEIVRREKEIRLREKATDEKIRGLEERLNSVTTQNQPKKDALKALEEAGFSYEDATRAIVHQKEGDINKSPEVVALEKQLAAVQERLDKQDQTWQQRDAEKQINEYKSGINKHIEDQGNKYELIKSYGQSMTDAVFETVIKTKEEEGRSITVDEACILVENELEKNLKSQFDSLKNLEKTKTWFGENPTSQAPSENSADSPASRAVTEVKEAQGSSDTPTQITNDMARPDGLPVKRKLSTEESKAQAASLIKWTN